MNKIFQKIKLEFFYIRQMLKRRFPLRYWSAYVKNRYFGLGLLKRMEPWRTDGHDDFEVHVLAPKSGLWMLAWSLKSFLYHSDLAPSIVVHSDWSIDPVSVKMFESKFSNLKVILRKDGDRMIQEMPDVPEKIKKYRMAKAFPIMELTDIYLLSKTNTVMLLDFDILFYKKPQEIVDFVQGRLTIDALSTRYSKGTPLNVKEEYAVQHKLIERGAPQVISGIIIFHKHALPLNRLIEYFDNTLDPASDFIEQAGWGSLLAQSNFQWLDEARYPVKGMSETAVCKHFTSPRRFELYAYGIDLVRKNINHGTHR